MRLALALLILAGFVASWKCGQSLAETAPPKLQYVMDPVVCRMVAREARVYPQYFAPAD